MFSSFRQDGTLVQYVFQLLALSPSDTAMWPRFLSPAFPQWPVGEVLIKVSILLIKLGLRALSVISNIISLNVRI